MDAATEARSFFQTTTPNGTYLRLGVILAQRPYTDIIINNAQINRTYLTGQLRIQENHWYYLIMTIDNSANFSSIIWDAENPESQLNFTQQLSSEWENQIWDFAIRGKSGKLYLEEYMRIEIN